ncbi:MAG TPA: peptidoglycan DD-metalloendopeptidase family protein [Acidimicrobiales bacterium]|nr:peptidoglycan DD-metalloendopeptidase family protein [Acidimicrobiales bacterium]
MRRLAVVAAAVVLLAGAAPARAEPNPASRVDYRPPVDAPIVDPFRPPANSYAAGNRGVDYATAPDTPVRSAAPGQVVFAGPVGGTLHVVVLHADGIRTSYSFLRSTSVRRGDTVEQGQEVGRAAEGFHFGARAGGAYIDPTLLFSDGPPHVYLVSDGDRRQGTLVHERRGLLDSLQGLAERAVGVPADAVDWARNQVARQAANTFDELRGAAHYAWELQPGVHVARIGKVGLAWWGQRDDCTPASTPTPQHADRHIAVLVGGLGSSSGRTRDDPGHSDAESQKRSGAAIDDVDTGALGFAPRDVMRFSYNGGTITENPYDAADSTVDIRQSARRLRELLERVAAENPGVPIDVLAHSQGGLVSRAALGDEIDPGSPALPPINSLVTIGTPHQGADLATAAKMISKSDAGRRVIGALGQAGAPVTGESVGQLAETSEFVRRLNDRPLPPGIRVTSIGGRGDPVVPAGRTHLDGARNVIVRVPSLFDQHSELPGAASTTREIALGQAGLPPTCQSLVDMVADTALSDTIGWVEDTAATAAWLGTRPFTVPAGLTSPIHERKNP